MYRSTKQGLLFGFTGICALAIAAVLIVEGVTHQPRADLGTLAVGASVGILAGFPMTVATFIYLRRGWRRRALLAASGNRPWTIRDDWRDGSVVASIPLELAFSWLVAIGLVALSAVFVLLVDTYDDDMDQAICVIGWLMAGMAVAALALEAVHVRRRLVHGRPELVLPEVPLVQGRRYAVAVWTGARVVEPGDVLATVECTKIEDVGRSRRVTKLAGEPFRAHTSDSHMEIERTVLPIEISLPAGLPDREDDEDPNVRWTLTVTSDAFAARLKAAFDLPVFARSDDERPPSSATRDESK